MIRLTHIVLAGTFLLGSAPAFAQGQGGYDPGVAGAETARMSATQRADARRHHDTNDTSGGSSSIDKSGKTQEGGGTIMGQQPGQGGGGQTVPQGR